MQFLNLIGKNGEFLQWRVFATEGVFATGEFLQNRVYHLKGINFVKSININKKISDLEILIGQAKENILKNERFTLIEINDEKKK